MRDGGTSSQIGWEHHEVGRLHAAQQSLLLGIYTVT